MNLVINAQIVGPDLSWFLMLPVAIAVLVVIGFFALAIVRAITHYWFEKFED